MWSRGVCRRPTLVWRRCPLATQAPPPMSSSSSCGFADVLPTSHTPSRHGRQPSSVPGLRRYRVCCGVRRYTAVNDASQRRDRSINQ